MSVYGNLDQNLTSNLLYENLMNEFANFDSMMLEFGSINVVNEAVSFSTILNKIKELWKKFKLWVKEKLRWFKDKIKDLLLSMKIEYDKTKSEKIQDNKENSDKENPEYEKKEFSLTIEYYWPTGVPMAGIFDDLNNYIRDLASTNRSLKVTSSIIDMFKNYEDRTELDNILEKAKDTINEDSNRIFKEFYNIKQQYKKFFYESQKTRKETITDGIFYKKEEQIKNKINFIERASKNATEYIIKIQKNIGDYDEYIENIEKEINEISSQMEKYEEKIKLFGDRAVYVACNNLYSFYGNRLSREIKTVKDTILIGIDTCKILYQNNQHNKRVYMMLKRLLDSNGQAFSGEKVIAIEDKNRSPIIDV